MKSALSFVAAAFVAGVASAQPVAGDFFVATSAGVYAVDRATSSTTTLTTVDVARTAAWVGVDHDNESAVAIVNTLATSHFLRLRPGSPPTTLTSLPMWAQAATLDQDSHWLIAGPAGSTSATSHLARFRGVSALDGVTTIKSYNERLSGITHDPDTGDFFATTTLGGAVLRIQRAAHTVVTLASGFSSIVDIDHDQTRGFAYFVTTAPTDNVRIRHRSGTAKFATVPGARGVVVDDLTGHVYVHDAASITELDPTGATVRSWSLPTIGTIQSIALPGSRKLRGGVYNTSKPNSSYQIIGEFTGSPNRPYALGLGISGLRPGVALSDGRTINILPDVVTFLSVNGLLGAATQRFAGTTNPTGQFVASFGLPNVPITFPPIVVAGVVFNPAFPGGLDVAPSLAVKVMP